MNHGKGMALAAACDIHLECCTGDLQEEWKVNKTASFHQFREKLVKQMLTCAPALNLCAGDTCF